MKLAAAGPRRKLEGFRTIASGVQTVLSKASNGSDHGEDDVRMQPISCQIVIAIAMGVSLSSKNDPRGSAAAVGAGQDETHTSLPDQNSAGRLIVCEREGKEIAGQKPVQVGRSIGAPKRVRYVSRKYPELPEGTVGSGMWIGEALIDQAGKIARVWPIREVTLVPPFPEFNRAIPDGIQQWRFEPVLVQGKPTPVCMTVTVNIDWQ